VNCRIAVGQTVLSADLTVPPSPRGIVAFAHGSGSGRHSPRNRYVAGELARGGLATLLMDLLTPEEEAEDLRTGRLRFDIPLLAGRVIGAIDWLERDDTLSGLPVGLFGASTGAAAALAAAAARPGAVRAVVSRGGRPDLAGPDALRGVRAPTLLIVGALDAEVLALNRAAAAELPCEHRVAVVAGAGHLFEEPGALDTVVRLAADWFGPRLADGGAA
jgi:putative phosphoribosyl transferase